jgi:hypothetical protein
MSRIFVISAAQVASLSGGWAVIISMEWHARQFAFAGPALRPAKNLTP